jgi:polyferredoxin/CRP-like cAMP-binding protein
MPKPYGIFQIELATAVLFQYVLSFCFEYLDLGNMPNTLLPAEPKSMKTEGLPQLFKPLLTEKISVREYNPGESITAAAHGNDRILCLLSGKAEVVVGYRAAHEVIVEHLEPGDVFGDMAFLTGRTWPADAQLVALEQCKVLDISVNSFQRVLRENPEFAVSLLKSLGKKFVHVERNEFASSIKLDGPGAAAVCAYPTHPGLPEVVQARFRALAQSDDSVLIVGENGVGKDILAYAIFDAASSHDEVLVPVDVRRIEADPFFLRPGARADQKNPTVALKQMRFLFGAVTRVHEGETVSSAGYIDLAHEGTLFIRGAHRLAPTTQQKLLDALKTGVYCPLGSNQRIQIDCRLICTTELSPSMFHPDQHPLLYELAKRALVVPPLRKRSDQISVLANYYLAYYADEMHRRVPELADLTLKAMIDYSWPGNDLELANAMRRAVVVSPADVVRRQDLTFDARRTDGSGRFNLLRLKPFRQAFFSPLFPAILQSAFVPVFLTTLLLLFMGPPDPSKNLASLAMWAMAWPAMIVGAFFAARIWCSVCAIGALSKLAKRIVSLEIPFPEILKMRSDFLIAGGILLIIWMESATDIRSSPFNLGLLLLTMFILAFLLNTVFARQAWCRYLCPLGGMNGLLARTSVLELRADSATCLASCSSQECYYGTPQTEGCPFGQVVATLHSNQFCRICGNCAKNCPYDAIKLNLRAPGYELGEVRHVRTGTGFLVLGLMGALLSDLVTRLPEYHEIISFFPGSDTVKFTFVYVGLILAVNLLAAAASALSHRMFRERFFENYSRFGLALLPLTSAGLLAFHTHYFMKLVPQMLVLLGGFFNLGEAGSLAWSLSPAQTLVVQQVLLGIGLVWTLITMHRLGGSSARGRYGRRLGVLPHTFVAGVLAGLLFVVIRAAFAA